MSETTRIRLDKQIQRGSKARQVALTDANGEFQFADVDPLIKSGETLTHLNSVEINAGNLIIKYTAEDGLQQVVSTVLAVGQQDIKITDAKMDNPSAGVYRLIITENDGSQFPVDLSALLAVVTRNTTYLTMTGNGTPQAPLSIDLSQSFWDKLPKTLDNFDDVTVTDDDLETQISKGGTVVLVWDNQRRQWLPKSVATLDNYTEVTQNFNNLIRANNVSLSLPIAQIVPQSIKVFRNGLRQQLGIDYDFSKQGQPNDIVFTEPFTAKQAESVTVDFRPINYMALAV